MENKEGKAVIDELTFKNFERQAMASVDKLVQTSLVNFMFISMFRNSSEPQKEDIVSLLTAMRRDIAKVHKEKADIDFIMTKEQKESYSTSIENTVNLCLKLIDKEVALFKKVQEEVL